MNMAGCNVEPHTGFVVRLDFLPIQAHELISYVTFDFVFSMHSELVLFCCDDGLLMETR